MTVEEGSDDAGGALKVGAVVSTCSRTTRHLEMEARLPE